MKKVCPLCGNWKSSLAACCRNCRDQARRDTLTIPQRAAIQALVHFDGDLKAVARATKRSWKSVESQMVILRHKLKVQSYAGIINWAWRNGLVYGLILCLATLQVLARHHRLPPPPPAVTVNAVVSWDAVSNASAYNLQWYGLVGPTGAVMTFFTNDTITGLPTNTLFTFAVRSLGSNGVWGPFATIDCVSASPGITNHCP